MTLFQALGLFILGYLVLLGRSAWKQGELPQFLRSMAVVALIGGLIYGSVIAWNAIHGY